MKWIVIAFFLLKLTIVNAQDLTVVAVGDASLEREKIVFVEPEISGKLSKPHKSMVREFYNLLKSDFSHYRLKFEVVSRKSVKTDVFGKPEFAKLASNKIGYVVFMEATKAGAGDFLIKLKAFGVGSESLLLSDEVSTGKSNLRKRGHIYTDKLYRSITGKKSIFTSFIIFVSDRIGHGGKILKEMYIMDFDGHNKKRLTHHNGMVISPSISSNNRYILYSMISDNVSRKRNIDLYLYDRRSKKSRLLSSRKGINSGAVFLPDGKNIAVTLTHTGNAEIYSLNLKSGLLRRITRHYAIDVDPSVNNDGSIMSFLSGRSGKAHIYTLDPRGTEKNVRRISFVGMFNATPRFSPDGKNIAFASWMDGHFDIFRIGANGKNLVRLTKNFGSNEDPTWSSDGQFIAFSSQRVISRTKATHNIYLMDKDGEIIGPVTKSFGSCITPRWSR